MKKKTIVYVRWLDSSYQRGECTQSELDPEAELESAGLLAREDEKSISIALDHHEEAGTWRFVLHILKRNVLSIRRIKI